MVYTGYKWSNQKDWEKENSFCNQCSWREETAGVIKRPVKLSIPTAGIKLKEHWPVQAVSVELWGFIGWIFGILIDVKKLNLILIRI